MKNISSNNNNNKSISNESFSDSVALQINKTTFRLIIDNDLRRIKIHSITITIDRIVIKTDGEKVEIDISDCENAFDFTKQVETGLVTNEQFIRPEVVHMITGYLDKYPKSIEKILLYFKQLDSNLRNDKNEN
jgi:hypothetical protein